MPINFVCGVVMLTSLVWTEDAVWTKHRRGLFGCQTGGSGSRMGHKRHTGFHGNQLLCCLCFSCRIMQIRSILLPTDFSECGNYALSYAASLAHTFKASIICINVIEPIVPTVGYSGMTEPLPMADITEQLEDSAERELPKLAECDECSGIDV